jgi:hypothetical protein
MMGRLSKKYSYKGVTLTAKEWGEKLGIGWGAFRQRLDDLSDPDRIFAAGYFRKPRGKTQRHGQSHSRSYYSWQDMHKRCYNPKSNKWHRYGARGIKVCKRWRLFANFLADMGERPLGKTLDRRDNNGNYEKNNCRWATPKQQGRNSSKNRKVDYKGKTFNTLIELAEYTGVAYVTLRMRLQRGFTIEQAANPHNLR